MSYDFLDPNQENEYRSKAKSGGLSNVEIERYIRSQKTKLAAQQQVGLDLYEGQLDIRKKEQDVMSADRLTSTAISNITDIQASKTALNSLEKSIQSRKSLLGPIKGTAGKLNPYAVEAQDLQGEIDAVRQLVGKAMEEGVLRKEDEEKYKKILPKLTDTPAVALRKIENVYNLLSQKEQSRTSGLQGSGYDVSGLVSSEPAGEYDVGEAPALNLKGEVAQSGDLIFDDARGEVSFYSEPVGESVFRTTKEGSNIDNAFIKFLADSEFLPIVGSILGGISGAGFASVATGAAGAAAGKVMQQGIRELFDPERQDISDMARAVLIEGTTDAILGGVTFGIFQYAKGLKLVIGKGAKETAEAFGKEAIEAGFKETAEAGIKETTEQTAKEAIESFTYKKPGVVKSQISKLINTELGISKTDASAFLKNFGETPAEMLIRTDIPKNAAEAFVTGSNDLVKYGKVLDNLLEGKGTLKADDLLDILKKSRTAVGDNPAMSAVVSQIDEQIKYVKTFGTEIPASKVNNITDIFQNLGKESYTVSGKSTMQSGVYGDIGSQFNHYMRQEIPGFGSTNQQKSLAYILQKSGLNATSAQKAKKFMGWGDAMLLGTKPAYWFSKKGVDVFKALFATPLTQANVLNEAMQLAASQGDKQATRRLLRFSWRLGVGWTASRFANIPSAPAPEQEGPGMGLGSSPTNGMSTEDLTKNQYLLK